MLLQVCLRWADFDQERVKRCYIVLIQSKRGLKLVSKKIIDKLFIKMLRKLELLNNSQLAIHLAVLKV